LMTRDGQAATIASPAFSRRLAGKAVLEAAILLSSGDLATLSVSYSFTLHRARFHTS
jgi:hypothetical protein